MSNIFPSDSVVAVIAAYNPAPTLVKTARDLARQVNHIVVVDDGSTADGGEVLRDLEQIGVHVHRQGSNKGIGAALNAGVKVAEAMFQPDFLLTLDQDSILSENYVRQALETYNSAQTAGINVGFISAFSYSGHKSPTLDTIKGFIQAFDPMQSGFVIPRTTFNAVGHFAEDFFIDGVDSEFTMRCRRHGLLAIIAPGCTIEHDLGARGRAQLLGRSLHLFGKEVHYNYHSPSRVYYICRNGTILSRRYMRHEPRWVLRRLLEESKAHLLRFLFSPNRVKLVTAASAGFRDALVHRSGRISPELEKRLH